MAAPEDMFPALARLPARRPGVRGDAGRFPWRRSSQPAPMTIPAGGVRVVEVHTLVPRRGFWRPVLHGVWRLWVASSLGAVAGALVAPAAGAATFSGLVAHAVAHAFARRWPRFAHRLARARGRLRLAAGGTVAAAARKVEPVPPVRLCGTVLPGPGFTSAGGQDGCVVAYYIGYVGSLRGTSADAAAQGEVHAIDFAVLVEGRDVVHVETGAAMLLERPVRVDAALLARRPLCAREVSLPAGGPGVASVHYEEVIRAGDTVEVLGHLQREVDPGASAGYRRPALRLVVRGDAHQRLVLRRTSGS